MERTGWSFARLNQIKTQKQDNVFFTHLTSFCQGSEGQVSGSDLYFFHSEYWVLFWDNLQEGVVWKWILNTEYWILVLRQFARGGRMKMNTEYWILVLRQFAREFVAFSNKCFIRAICKRGSYENEYATWPPSVLASSACLTPPLRHIHVCPSEYFKKWTSQYLNISICEQEENFNKDLQLVEEWYGRYSLPNIKT